MGRAPVVFAQCLCVLVVFGGWARTTCVVADQRLNVLHAALRAGIPGHVGAPPKPVLNRGRGFRQVGGVAQGVLHVLHDGRRLRIAAHRQPVQRMTPFMGHGAIASRVCDVHHRHRAAIRVRLVGREMGGILPVSQRADGEVHPSKETDGLAWQFQTVGHVGQRIPGRIQVLLVAPTGHVCAKSDVCKAELGLEPVWRDIPFTHRRSHVARDLVNAGSHHAALVALIGLGLVIGQPFGG